MELLKLEEMTLEQKIGHLICARGAINEEDKEFIYEMVRKKALGGIQGYPGAIRMELTKKALEIAEYPILICSDMETGIGDLRYPSPMGMASMGNPELAYKIARATAIKAKSMGINVVWGPVVDFAVKGGLCNGQRCFGNEAEKIAELAIQVVKGYTDEGMVCTAKHFVCDSTQAPDTHMIKGVSKRTAEELRNNEMIPYLRCMKEANLPGIMTTHTLHENIDDKYINSLSKSCVDLIRKEGFDGLIVTDSLAMMGIVQDYGLVDCLGLAIAAGNDMVLPNYRLSVKESFDSLMQAYEKGVFDDERLNDAVRHVLEAEEKAMKKPSMTELDDELKQAIADSWKNSVVGIYKDGVSPALDKNTKKHFVLVCENTYPDVDGFNQEVEISAKFGRQNRMKLAEKLLKEFPGSTYRVLSEWPNMHEGQSVCVETSESDEVIFFTFATCGCYLGTDCLTRRVEALIESNMYKVSAIVHIGNPFELAKFPEAKRLFNAIAPEAEEHIIRALKGEFIPTGKLPVNID